MKILLTNARRRTRVVVQCELVDLGGYRRGVTLTQRQYVRVRSALMGTQDCGLDECLDVEQFHGFLTLVVNVEMPKGSVRSGA